MNFLKIILDFLLLTSCSIFLAAGAGGIQHGASGRKLEAEMPEGPRGEGRHEKPRYLTKTCPADGAAVIVTVYNESTCSTEMERKEMPLEHAERLKEHLEECRVAEDREESYKQACDSDSGLVALFVYGTTDCSGTAEVTTCHDAKNGKGKGDGGEEGLREELAELREQMRDSDADLEALREAMAELRAELGEKPEGPRGEGRHEKPRYLTKTCPADGAAVIVTVYNESTCSTEMERKEMPLEHAERLKEHLEECRVAEDREESYKQACDSDSGLVALFVYGTTDCSGTAEVTTCHDAKNGKGKGDGGEEGLREELAELREQMRDSDADLEALREAMAELRAELGEKPEGPRGEGHHEKPRYLTKTCPADGAAVIVTVYNESTCSTEMERKEMPLEHAERLKENLEECRVAEDREESYKQACDSDSGLVALFVYGTTDCSGTAEVTTCHDAKKKKDGGDSEEVEMDVVTSVESVVSFATLNIEDISTSPEAEAAFRMDFITAMAAHSNRSETDIVIQSIMAGSVKVKSAVIFRGIVGGKDGESFSHLLRSDVSRIFASHEFEGYGEVTSSEVATVPHTGTLRHDGRGGPHTTPSHHSAGGTGEGSSVTGDDDSDAGKGKCSWWLLLKVGIVVAVVSAIVMGCRYMGWCRFCRKSCTAVEQVSLPVTNQYVSMGESKQSPVETYVKPTSDLKPAPVYGVPSDMEGKNPTRIIPMMIATVEPVKTSSPMSSFRAGTPEEQAKHAPAVPPSSGG
ncbi:hypothetical protein CYMTET_13102 [Cymbomonas tetramitiformis]|uniref:Uncharacterized protein n=1 Tax=Cymbomonas tetramitiformis TaxID=36881 RepID=A0AAE0GKB9_9CHLO|nr:hypothetical protein CYMTET_13102 [Cymbomonas tetramitiformis]